jgi:hypothetical protein
MATVYWSPWYPTELYSSLHLLYDEPVSLLQDIKHKQSKGNRTENWYQCHAFLNSIKNTYVLKFPSSVTFGLHKDFGIINVVQNDPNIQFVSNKQPSVNGAFTFAILNNWLFWSDEPLEISSMPAYLHKPVFDGYYVPGSFNINSWFRPLEAAIQLNEGVEIVSIQKDDPLAYVKFHTNEPVTLKRFYMTKELEEMSQACIGYKRHDSSRGLSFLYSRFHKNGMNKIISREIHKNLMD